jgi:ribosome modulation factor
MKDWIQAHSSGILATLAIVGVLSLVITMIVVLENYTSKTTQSSTGQEIKAMNKTAYERGAKSYRAGIGKDENPYWGSNGSVWLDGWMDAKIQQEQNYGTNRKGQ